jgi:hypothetical protein
MKSKNVESFIEIRSDYEIIRKLNDVLSENKNLYNYSYVINKILIEYFKIKS